MHKPAEKHRKKLCNRLAFLKEHYEVEHTLSLDDAVEDMMLICKQNGGRL